MPKQQTLILLPNACSCHAAAEQVQLPKCSTPMNTNTTRKKRRHDVRATPAKPPQNHRQLIHHTNQREAGSCFIQEVEGRERRSNFYHASAAFPGVHACPASIMHVVLPCLSPPASLFLLLSHACSLHGLLSQPVITASQKVCHASLFHVLGNKRHRCEGKHSAKMRKAAAVG